MNDSLRSISTNDSEGLRSKKKKKNSAKRSQTLSYQEALIMLNPTNLFVAINLQPKFEEIVITPEQTYFPNFRFAIDLELNPLDVKWRRLPCFERLAPL